MKNVIVPDNSINDHYLGVIRDIKTDTDGFRRGINIITTVMASYVLADLSLEEVEITTPITNTTAKRFNKIPVLVPIVRAGLYTVDPFTTILPNASVYHIGMGRIESEKGGTTEITIHTYLNKLPENMEGRKVIISDPMLATGSSIGSCVDEVIKRGVKEENIKYICILASREGIEYVASKYPSMRIFCAAIDEVLLPNKYISPGLGDAGDRLCGTVGS